MYVPWFGVMGFGGLGSGFRTFGCGGGLGLGGLVLRAYRTPGVQAGGSWMWSVKSDVM